MDETIPIPASDSELPTEFVAKLEDLIASEVKSKSTNRFQRAMKLCDMAQKVLQLYAGNRVKEVMARMDAEGYDNDIYGNDYRVGVRNVMQAVVGHTQRVDPIDVVRDIASQIHPWLREQQDREQLNTLNTLRTLATAQGRPTNEIDEVINQRIDEKLGQLRAAQPQPTQGANENGTNDGITEPVATPLVLRRREDRIDQQEHVPGQGGAGDGAGEAGPPDSLHVCGQEEVDERGGGPDAA